MAKLKVTRHTEQGLVWYESASEEPITDSPLVSMARIAGGCMTPLVNLEQHKGHTPLFTEYGEGPRHISQLPAYVKRIEKDIIKACTEAGVELQLVVEEMKAEEPTETPKAVPSVPLAPKPTPKPEKANHWAVQISNGGQVVEVVGPVAWADGVTKMKGLWKKYGGDGSRVRVQSDTKAGAITAALAKHKDGGAKLP